MNSVVELVTSGKSSVSMITMRYVSDLTDQDVNVTISKHIEKKNRLKY